jgi:adenylate cyclase
VAKLRRARLSPGLRLLLSSGLRAGATNVAANVVGAALVFVYLRLILPAPQVRDPAHWFAVNLTVFAILVPLTVVIGTATNARYLLRLRAWLDAGALPGGGQRAALAYPRFALRVNASLWLVSAAVFGVINLGASAVLARNVAVTVAYGGVAVSAVSYLLGDRSLRPLAAAALAGGLPERDSGPGVRTRIGVAWVVGGMLPLLGVAVAILLSPQDVPVRTAVSALFIAGAGLVIGAVAINAAAGSVAEPVGSLRRAVAGVTRGDLATSLEVYDGSELGRLQAGFNVMVDGLRERDRLADLFGRQVGTEVAALALARGVDLVGERRTVGVLFVDVLGSTTLAVTVPAEEVVVRLNEFFAVVVSVVAAAGGTVNKFEGDAALCLFGAPGALGDPAGAALAAGRELTRQLVAAGGLAAAVGVSYGEVVAGNIGTEARYEYTVIGDPVNEAARLTELAKPRPVRLLASGAAVAAAGGEERACWQRDGAQLLRGRDAPTQLFVPVGAVGT